MLRLDLAILVSLACAVGLTKPGPGAAGFDCDAIRREVAQMERVIETHRYSAEATQRWADDTDRSALSRRKAELRAREEVRWLGRTEAELERFRGMHRERGVPDRCWR